MKKYILMCFKKVRKKMWLKEWGKEIKKDRDFMERWMTVYDGYCHIDKRVFGIKTYCRIIQGEDEYVILT